MALVLASPSFLLPSVTQPPNLHQQGYDATFALYAQKGDKVHFLCTATAYEKRGDTYRLITAGHCFTDLVDGITFSVAKQIGGTRMPVTVLKYTLKDDVDFGVIELKSTETYPLVELATKFNERIGSRVFVPHFTEGLYEQVSEGPIASTVMGGNIAPEDCSHCNHIVMAHLFGGPGMSGAAVISERTHKIIGIVVLRFHSNAGMGVEVIDGFRSFLQTN